MKKIFLFAIAAVGMTVGCQKFQEIFNPGEEQIDDSTPVKVVLGTNVAATATTKAALDNIEGLYTAGKPIYVYGLRVNATDLAEEDSYLLGSKDAALDITLTASTNPYTTSTYYGAATEDVYNFYGYYLGAATPGTVAVSGAAITVPFTINGQDDLLLAKTDKTKDLIAASSSENVTPSRIYSAYSARRGVKPNLVFEHQLTQFTFKLENGTTLKTDQELKVVNLGVMSESKGNLVITNNEGGKLVETPEAEGKSVIEFAYPKADNATEVHIFSDNTAKTLDGSIMVMPGKTEYEMLIDLAQTKFTDGAATEEWDNTDDVKVTIALPNGTEFKAGYSYEVTVRVYAAEAVVLDVSLVDWKAGESVYIDQDKDDAEVEKDNSTLYAAYSETTEGKMIYEVNVPETGYYNIQAAISESATQAPTDANAWVDIADTKAAATKFAIFTNWLADKIYYCHLRYTTTNEAVTETTVYQTVAPTEDEYAVSPAFDITKSYLVEDNWTSYSTKLPKSYTDGFPSITEETWATTAPSDLPWLAVECTPTELASIDVTKDGKLIRSFEWTAEDGSVELMTISGPELGYETLPAGTYVVEVNGKAADPITVPAE